MRSGVWVWGLALGAGWLGTIGVKALRADDAPAQTATKAEERNGSPPAAPKKPTVKVEKGFLKVEASLKGVVEAEQSTELQLKPQAWALPLMVEDATAHGASVKKGDVVLRLELDKIEESIEELELQRTLTELQISLAEEELPVLEKMLPIEMADAKRSKKIADEDLAQFLEVERPFSETMIAFEMKAANHWLESAKEELKQLEKMYRSNDLTEETEEFILKRHRFQVEMSQFQIKFMETQRDRILKVQLPRQEQSARESVIKQSLALQKAENTLPLNLKQKRLALGKLRLDFSRSIDRLAKLRKDREAMTVRAPVDGILYYGKCTRGQWSPVNAMSPKLQRGGMIAPAEVFMTIVTARPAFVRLTVEEKDLHELHPDMKGLMVPTGFPDLKRPAWLKELLSVPVGPGSFEARVAVDMGPSAQSLMPGMGCTVTFVAYRKDDALLVPASAVFADDDEGKVTFVYLPGKDGKAQKKPVATGKSSGGKTEILEGLAEGDEILSARP